MTHHARLHIDPDECKGIQPNAEIKVLQYNVNDAVREEAIDWARFRARLPAILSLMERVRADVILVQEITQREHLIEFVHQLSVMGYDSAYGRRNSTSSCTSNLVAWRAERFHMCSAENLQLLGDPCSSDPFARTTPDDASHPGGWGANLFLVHLLECAPEELGRRLWWPPLRVAAGSTHFPVYDSSREACTRALGRWLVQREYGHWVVAGGLNTFGGKGGEEQISFLQDAAKSVDGALVGSTSVCETTGEIVKGTFFGYEHDDFRFPTQGPLDPLDHLAAGNEFDVASVVRLNAPLEGAENERREASDHKAILTTLKRRKRPLA